MTQQKKPGVRGIELKVILDTPARGQAGSGTKVRVVQWVHDKGFTVKLEKRAYYTKDGQVLPGKAEGFTLEDLAALHPVWKEMIQLMKNPPAPPPLPPAAPKDDEIIEEVPF